MALLAAPTDEEKALFCILTDPAGIDFAEMFWVDLEKEDHCFRAHPYQIPWWRCSESRQLDLCSRDVGKTLGIAMRCCNFMFRRPGQQRALVAPEKNHLTLLTGVIENRLMSTWITRAMMRPGRQAITHQPFGVTFLNGTEIVGRIPQRDGKGVKGIHSIELETDESQDLTLPAWRELVETIKRSLPGFKWMIHGVTKGVQDNFYRYSQPKSGFKVHRYCLPTGTLVYGTERPLAIEECVPGTPVFTVTEDGELSEDKVTSLIDNGFHPTWEVTAKGGYGLVTTFNHPYLILDRKGTRKTRYKNGNLGFEWVEAEDIRVGDYIICARELPSTGFRIPTSDEITSNLYLHSPIRIVPEWVWDASSEMQLAFLHGYLMGDGSLSRQTRGQDPWAVGTASERMAKELRALCHYLGLRATRITESPGILNPDGPQYRFYIYPHDSWFLQVPRTYSYTVMSGLGKNFVARRVDGSGPTGFWDDTWDITVGTTHNFIAEGVVVHNTAMHRPTWTEQEKQQKIQEYGGYNSPDYKRNVLGLHGDQASPLFPLATLMQCVDQDEGSDYNIDEYRRIDIVGEEVEEEGNVLGFLDFPALHLASGRYERFWMGMDVGMTLAPSEIIICGESHPKGRDKKPVLRTLLRIQMSRVKAPDQAAVIKWLINAYKPVCFAMDSTGVGLPIVQSIEAEARTSEDKYVLDSIKGYNFSSKVAVDIVRPDPDAVVDPWAPPDEGDPDLVMRNVLEASTDYLRLMVDERTLELPWDVDLVGQFQGQTWTQVKSGINEYAKRSFSMGSFHCLVAGTTVTTLDGEIPIESVQVGTLVLTRRGWKPVVDAWCANPDAEVLTVYMEDGRSLTGTAEHLVWTNERGWVCLDALRMGDTVSLCDPTILNQLAIQSACLKDSRLSSMASPSIYTQSPTVSLIGYISTVLLELSGYIEKFGNFIKVLSRTATTSIILMATPSIMILAILSACPPKNTFVAMDDLMIDSKPRSGCRILLESGRKQPYGMLLKRAVHGIKSMLEKLPLSNSLRSSFVGWTGQSMKRSVLVVGGAQLDVNSEHMRSTPRKRSSAYAVRTGVTSLFSAGEVALENTATTVNRVVPQRYRQSVYDLTVQDAHEFYANGILVHNCLDAFRMVAISYCTEKLNFMLKEAERERLKHEDVFLSTWE